MTEAKWIPPNESLVSGHFVKPAASIRSVLIVSIRERLLTLSEVISDLFVVWIRLSEYQVPLLLR